MEKVCAYCGKPFEPGQTLTSRIDEKTVHLECELLAEIETKIRIEKDERNDEIKNAKTTGELIRAQIKTPGDLANLLVNFAKKYTFEGSLESVTRNSHINNTEFGIAGNQLDNQKLVDSVIVDFINFVMRQYCMDLALYTRDLREPKVMIEPCCFKCKNTPEWRGCEVIYCYDNDGMDSFPHVCSVHKRLVRSGMCCDAFVTRHNDDN